MDRHIHCAACSLQKCPSDQGALMCGTWVVFTCVKTTVPACVYTSRESWMRRWYWGPSSADVTTPMESGAIASEWLAPIGVYARIRITSHAQSSLQDTQRLCGSSFLTSCTNCRECKIHRQNLMPSRHNHSNAPANGTVGWCPSLLWLASHRANDLHWCLLALHCYSLPLWFPHRTLLVNCFLVRGPSEKYWSGVLWVHPCKVSTWMALDSVCAEKGLADPAIPWSGSPHLQGVTWRVGERTRGMSMISFLPGILAEFSIVPPVIFSSTTSSTCDHQ